MTARLSALCSLIERTDSFIDVGCDHGYAVEYVYKNRLADKITACDISQPSLNKARNLLGTDSGITFVCADGAAVAHGYDTVLISGMGGLEIMRVIKSSEPKTFILSPQSHASDVRSLLMERDYRITKDFTVKSGKYYDIIKAERGGGREQSASVTEVMLSYGIFVHEYNEALCDRLNNLLQTVKSFKPTPQNERKLQLIEEALRWQSR